MGAYMFLQVAGGLERLCTSNTSTLVWLFPSMNAPMTFYAVTRSKRFTTALVAAAVWSVT